MNTFDSTESKENLLRYLEVVLRIWNRIKHNADAMAALRELTASTMDPTLGHERSRKKRTLTTSDV